VTLTRAKASRTASSNTDDGAVPDAVRGLRVLSVEDKQFGRVVHNTILTDLGHQAEFIGRGEAAPARIAQGSFDAVLMDMVLPGIDGIGFYYLTDADVVRHRLVREIIKAYAEDSGA